MIITIDGPCASGKSSLACELARCLNVFYLNTGLLYRAVAYLLSKKYQNHFVQGGSRRSSQVPIIMNLSKDLHHERDIDFKVDEQDLLMIQKISYEYHNEAPQIFFDGKNITDYLNGQDMGQLASVISANKQVREALLVLQREAAQKYDIVADGRDCGSVIFPHADYKFYLTASIDFRAQRRLLDVQRKNGIADFKKIKEELEARDHRDMHRDVAPLKIPQDAIIIDNSTMTFEETVEAFLRVIKG